MAAAVDADRGIGFVLVARGQQWRRERQVLGDVLAWKHRTAGVRGFSSD
jgi:hypothetical protein